MSKQKTSTKKQKVLNVILIILLVIVIVLLVAVISAYAYYKSKLALIQRPDDSTVTGEVIIDSDDPEVSDLDDEINQHLGELGEDPYDPSQDSQGESWFPPETDDPGTDDPGTDDPVKDEPVKLPTKPAIGEYKDKNVYNILLIGTDERSKGFSTNARGDSCMLFSLNTNDYSMRLVSFERGMGVPILAGKYQGSFDWLTHTFRYGGADLLLRTVRECFAVDVDYYVRVNFATFKEGIESVGGVDIQLTAAEAEYVNSEVPGSALTSGRNHLNGEQALSYARCRQIDSDWSRIVRQRNVIQAAMNQLKSLNLIELDAALNELLPLVLTNMPDDMITKLLFTAPKFQGKTAGQMTIPVKGSYGGMTGLGGRSLYRVDFTKNAEALREFLYPGVVVAESQTGAENVTVAADLIAPPRLANGKAYDEVYERLPLAY